MPPLLPLLQTSYIAQGDTTGVVIVIVLVGGVVVALVVAALATGGSRAGGLKQAARFSRNAFKRAAAAHGLSRLHTETLEELAAATRTTQPMLLFTNSGLLDETLRRGIYSLNANQEMSEDERQRRLTLLLQIRQLIEKNARREGAVASTAMLRPGQELGLTFPDGSSLQSKVTHILRRMLACELPSTFDRNKWRKGTAVRAMLWRQGDSGYGFQTKVLAYDTMGGRPVFLLQHTKTMRRSQRRSHRRKEIGRNCFFYPVMILDSGHRKTARREAVVQESFRHLGVLQDVSAGGCSITTQAPLARGKLLRVDFELGNRRRIVAYGKVQRAGGVARRATMHVMFTKVSSRQMNEILSYVYQYDAAVPSARRAASVPQSR